MLDQPRLDPELLNRFAAIVGAKYAITTGGAEPIWSRCATFINGHTPCAAEPGSFDGSFRYPQARQ